MSTLLIYNYLKKTIDSGIELSQNIYAAILNVWMELFNEFLR